MSSSSAAVRWVSDHASPLTTLDSAAPLDDLRALAESVRDAGIVALAHSMRHSRELSAVSHRVLRLLVEEHGFRSLALEGDDPAARGLSAYIAEGKGDPREILAGSRSFWRTGELLDVVEWMRAYNERHPGDPVRFAEYANPEGGFTGMDHIERHLAETTLRWHERSGDRIVYWGGLAHMAVGAPGTTAGSRLRERLGAKYAAVGLTFHHGTALYDFPAPPADFAESVLGAAGHDAFTLDLRAGGDADPAARAWLDGPVTTRLIGPAYDPEHDADYSMTADSFTGMLDAVIHVREVTDGRPLEPAAR
ncbi:erythromycin esterase family protein [Streptomyces sp. NPDC048172]|uniref:erythromycin esterase family protein n=1 Tax=Streptomyces sp. NPDC048172 TaxID=3365505 RepID=UPI0037155C38